jgi:hypothetical protein
MSLNQLRVFSTATVIVLLAALALPTAALEEKKSKEKTWAFDSAKAGDAPAGFSVEVGEWKVAADPSAPSKPNAVAQLAKSKGPVFNVALLEGETFKDLELSVKLRSVEGDIDQGGGLVWRAKDAKNYYIARHNPLEENFRVYKVVDGKRTQLRTAEVKPASAWQEIRIEMSGDVIRCFLDGKQHLEAKDGTFPDAGRIGLWTKADAQTHFDDLKVTAR